MSTIWDAYKTFKKQFWKFKTAVVRPINSVDGSGKTNDVLFYIQPDQQQELNKEIEKDKIKKKKFGEVPPAMIPYFDVDENGDLSIRKHIFSGVISHEIKKMIEDQMRQTSDLALKNKIADSPRVRTNNYGNKQPEVLLVAELLTESQS